MPAMRANARSGCSASVLAEKKRCAVSRLRGDREQIELHGGTGGGPGGLPTMPGDRLQGAGLRQQVKIALCEAGARSQLGRAGVTRCRAARHHGLGALP